MLYSQKLHCFLVQLTKWRQWNGQRMSLKFQGKNVLEISITLSSHHFHSIQEIINLLKSLKNVLPCLIDIFRFQEFDTWSLFFGSFAEGSMRPKWLEVILTNKVP